MNKKVTRIISLMTMFSCVTIGFTSCEKHDANSPGVEFMADMYRSPSLESNMSYTSLTDSTVMQANRLPVEGSIARGFMPYMYANDTAGYANAGRFLHNPLEKNEINLKKGEELYGKFCVHCHGAAGAGDGLVGAKLPGAPPSYTGAALKNLPEGKIFHSITYGKGLMGPHASLLDKEERWKIVQYVQKLQNPEGAAPAAAAPVTAEAPTATTEAK
ncbi:MAG: cytochrome c [Bacteroidia bacterium]|nr:cytochrome c [Bacteroidia bacterium]